MVVKLIPVIPKKQFKVADMQRELDKAIMSTLKTGQKAFKQTTRTWETRVAWIIETPHNYRGSVGTDNSIYTYVSRGTRPHLITPTRASILAFPSGTYTARTAPGVLLSRRNRVSGAGTVYTKRVQHPGTKARNFEETVAKGLQKVFERNVSAAIAKVVG